MLVSAAESSVSLFRIFLMDGSSAVSYGEYTRVDDEVVFSMPSATPSAPPSSGHLARTRWWTGLGPSSTDSVRYRRYAETRGESDFRAEHRGRASLNEIALTTDRQRALAIADEARRMLSDMAAAHLDTGRTMSARSSR